jgi:hypothetical protein
MIFARYAIQSPTKEWSKINVEAAFGETIDCSGSGQLLLGIDWGSVLQRSKPSVLSKLMARAVAPQSISEKYP